jgi:hypothetical protein
LFTFIFTSLEIIYWVRRRLERICDVTMFA